MTPQHQPGGGQAPSATPLGLTHPSAPPPTPFKEPAHLPRGVSKGACYLFSIPLAGARVPFQFSSVTRLCPTLCDPMDCSTPGLPVHHHLLELTQTHVHGVGDAIQPSHTLWSPSPPAFNLSQHQGHFKCPRVPVKPYPNSQSGLLCLCSAQLLPHFCRLRANS